MYVCIVFTYPSWLLWNARTIEGLEYALLVTQVQCTANIIKIIKTASITMLFKFELIPLSCVVSCLVRCFSFPAYKIEDVNKI